jgi:predicted DNA-binding transcriptional regulator YafY
MADPTARVLRLLSLLQTYRFWPGPELAEALDVSERTVRRDVDRLRELGYSVDATPGVAGGYRLSAGAHLPPLVLDDDEAVAIAVGLRTAAGASIDGIEDLSIRAMAKLEQVLPDRLRRRVSSVHANVTSMRWSGGPTVDPDALALLAQGCRDDEEVRFEYEARDGEQTSRLVQPHHLVSSGHRWYLIAWDVRRDDWRTFRLDRLSEPRLAGKRFPPRELPGGSPEAFVERSIRDRPLAHEAEVLVDGPPDAVQDLSRWLGAEVEPLPDDPERCRVRLKSESVEWLTGMVGVLAVRFPVLLVSPEELTPRIQTLGANLPV